MRSFAAVWIALVMVAGLGCDSHVAAPQAAPAQSPTGSPATPDGPSAAPAAARPPAAATSPPVGEDAQEAARRLAEALGGLQATMQAMRDAAKAAGGSTACEHGYLSRVAALAARDRSLDADPRMANAPRPRWVIAPRGRYLSLCETLPEPVQRCASFEHFADGAGSCRDDVAGLSPEGQRVWNEMFHEEPATP